MPRGGRRSKSSPLQANLRDMRQLDYTTGRKRAVYTALMYAKQDGLCAVCRKELDDNAVVDHCHTSGRIRGLLCRPCNLMLGAARDDPNTLRRGANYILASQAVHGVPSEIKRIDGPLGSPSGGELDDGPPQA